MTNSSFNHISTVYFLRHGEIATPGILAGQTDVALSEIGMNQLIDATEHLGKVKRVISSPLQRCYQFSSYFSQAHLIPLEVDDRLQEMNFGQWDGKTYQNLWQQSNSKDLIGLFWQDPWQVTPPEGEAIDEFVNRVNAWWQSLLVELKQHNVSDDHTLVVTHAGVIKLLLAIITEMPIPGTHHLNCFDISYAGLIKIEIFHDSEGMSWPKLIFS